GNEPVLVRVQLESVVGDVFNSTILPTRDFLTASMKAIDEAGRGVLVYLRTQEIMGFQADAPMDDRDYGVGAQILRALGLRKICLLTNSQAKRVGLKGYGLEVVDHRSLLIDSGVTPTPPIMELS